MTTLTLDAAMLIKLQNLADFMELRDESGRLLGYFHPAARVSDPKSPARPSPFSDDDLRRRQQQRTGKSLSEVLAKLPST